MEYSSGKYLMNLSIEEIKLPPFEDILVLGSKSKYGKIGLSKSLNLLEPDCYEMFNIDDDNVVAVFINKGILNKIKKDKIISILREKVFPIVSSYEILKINLNLKIIFDSIEEEL